MIRILLIEDNETIARLIKLNLEHEGMCVEVARDGDAGLRRASESELDLIILDLMLPLRNGYSVLQLARERGVETPVIVLTALGEESNRLSGFSAGADDYVTKPFSVLELSARIHAVLRRANSKPRTDTNHTTAIRIFGDLRIDEGRGVVERDGIPLNLRPKEFDLLLALIEHAGQVMTRKELLSVVWGYETGVISRTVDTHLGELRRKIEYDSSRPRHIFTVRKRGFKFEP